MSYGLRRSDPKEGAPLNQARADNARIRLAARQAIRSCPIKEKINTAASGLIAPCLFSAPSVQAKEVALKDCDDLVSENNTIKEQPASFYIGFNYKFGDVFTNYPVKKFYRDLSMKFLVKASSRPSESMGL
jgi:hypothetical protein